MRNPENKLSPENNASRRAVLLFLGKGALVLGTTSAGGALLWHFANQYEPLLWKLPELSHNSVKMLLVADIHAGASEQFHQKNLEAIPALKKVMAFRARLPKDLLLCNLGDSITKAPEQLQTVYDIMGTGIFALGNHDRWGIPIEILRDVYKKRGLYLYGAKDCDSFQMVWIDIEAPKPGIHGSIPDETLQWLEQTLRTQSDVPYILFMHYASRPIHDPENLYFATNVSATAPKNWEILQNILKLNPPENIFSAHMHSKQVNIYNYDNGIREANFPSFTEKLASNAGAGHPIVFFVVEIFPEAQHVTIHPYIRGQLGNQIGW